MCGRTFFGEKIVTSKMPTAHACAHIHTLLGVDYYNTSVQRSDVVIGRLNSCQCEPSQHASLAKLDDIRSRMTDCVRRQCLHTSYSLLQVIDCTFFSCCAVRKHAICLADTFLSGIRKFLIFKFGYTVTSGVKSKEFR